MLNLEIGQEWKFVHSVSVDGHTIPSGTRERVGAILSEVVEPKVTVVVLNQEPVEALTLAKHIITMHCRLDPERV